MRLLTPFSDHFRHLRSVSMQSDAADGKRVRARLVRLIQGYLKSEPAREATNLRKFCAVLIAEKEGERSTTQRMLHLHFAAAALAPSISLRLHAAAAGSGGASREEREEGISLAAELLCALVKLLKPVANEQPVTAEPSTPQAAADGGPGDARDALEVSHSPVSPMSRSFLGVSYFSFVCVCVQDTVDVLYSLLHAFHGGATRSGPSRKRTRRANGAAGRCGGLVIAISFVFPAV